MEYSCETIENWDSGNGSYISTASTVILCALSQPPLDSNTPEPNTNLECINEPGSTNGPGIASPNAISESRLRDNIQSSHTAGNNTTNGGSSRGEISPTKPTTPKRCQRLTTNSIDKSSETESTNLWTFIIHTPIAGINSNSKLKYIYADPGDHIHFVFHSTANNLARTRDAICRHFRGTSPQLAEAITTTQRVRSIPHYTRYLLRYGTRQIHYINGGIPVINSIIPGINVDGNINCLEMFMKREERIVSHTATVKRRNKEYLNNLIHKYQAKSFLDLERCLTEEEFDFLTDNYGPSTYKTYTSASVTVA